MKDPSIRFEEIQTSAPDLIQEIGGPGLKKNVHLPRDVLVELRRTQIRRLEDNIVILRKKQEEFRRKMEDYIAGLRGLIENLEKGMESEPASTGAKAAESGGTNVRCVGCGIEQLFPDLDVLFAREPEDVFSGPTEVIVQVNGSLKKGVFRCPSCGDCNLSIRPR